MTPSSQARFYNVDINTWVIMRSLLSSDLNTLLFFIVVATFAISYTLLLVERPHIREISHANTPGMLRAAIPPLTLYIMSMSTEYRDLRARAQKQDADVSRRALGSRLICKCT